MRILVFLSMSLFLLMASCGGGDTSKYTVASQNADCIGVGRQKCLLVKKGNAKEWEYFYSNIEGFDYEPGYEYVIEVRETTEENVPADDSSIRYTLVKVISKTEKTSENLPPIIASADEGYQCVGKVMAVDSENVGRGAAEGKFEVTVVKIRVTSSTNNEIKEGDVIHCELVPSPNVRPVVGREYVFKAKSLHPAHAKGVYLLDTNVMDLVY